MSKEQRDAFVAGSICGEVNLNGIAWDGDAIEKRTQRAKAEALRRYPDAPPPGDALREEVRWVIESRFSNIHHVEFGDYETLARWVDDILDEVFGRSAQTQGDTRDATVEHSTFAAPSLWTCTNCGADCTFSDLYKHGGQYEHAGHQKKPGERWSLWCGPVEPRKEGEG